MTKQSKKSHTKTNEQENVTKREVQFVDHPAWRNKSIHLSVWKHKKAQSKRVLFPFSPLWYPYFTCLPPGNIFVLGFTNKFRVEHLEKRGNLR